MTYLSTQSASFGSAKLIFLSFTAISVNACGPADDSSNETQTGGGSTSTLTTESGGQNPAGGVSSGTSWVSGTSIGGSSSVSVTTSGGANQGGVGSTMDSTVGGTSARGGDTSSVGGGSLSFGGTSAKGGNTATGGGTKAYGGGKATGGVSANGGGKATGGMSSGGVTATGGTKTSGTSTASCPETGHVTYSLTKATSPTAEQQTAYGKITAAMDTAVSFYNCYTNITKTINVSFVPSVATADGNINGSIRFGSLASMNKVTAMHEISHTVGIGTASNWSSSISNGIFTGTNAKAELQSLAPNEDAVHADSAHFWPYGLNYESEGKTEADLIGHCRMVMAIRKDLGLK